MSTSCKPHKGFIYNWRFIPIQNRYGCVIYGRVVGHPQFTGPIRTSLVLNVIENEVETLNSRYTLQGDSIATQIFIPPSAKIIEYLLSKSSESVNN